MVKKYKLSKILSVIILSTGVACATAGFIYFLSKNIRLVFLSAGFEFFLIIAGIVFYDHFQKNYGNEDGRGMKPFVLWFTGLPSSGKTTIAMEVYKFLKTRKYRVEKFDGESVKAIFPSTGNGEEDSINNIKKIGYLASLLEKNGVIVICSFVSPYERSRKFVRELCHNFIEVYVSTPIEICEGRDNKGLYENARTGLLESLTGVSAPYEVPVNPQLNIDTQNMSIEESFCEVKDFIFKNFSRDTDKEGD